MSNSNQSPLGSIEAPSRWRTINACRRCRQRKVKCSGRAPCQNCVNRRLSCVFDAVDRRLVVSERHLRDLERRAIESSNNQLPHEVIETSSRTGQGTQLSQTHPVASAPEPAVQDQTSVIAQHIEPLPSRPELQFSQLPSGPTQLDGQKGHNYPISTWGFSQEVHDVLGSPHHAASREKSRETNFSYNVALQHPIRLNASDVDLPPEDYIIHLARVADFHLNAYCHVFDLPSFLEQLRETRLHPLSKAAEPLFPKVLLIISLGKLFLEKAGGDTNPPGLREFLQGVDALPPSIVLRRDPLVATETLCLLAVYAHAVNLHMDAYLYIGQASRIIRSCEQDVSALDTGLEIPQSLSLTVFILDQRFSAIIGACPDSFSKYQLDKGSSLERSISSSSSAGLQLSINIAKELTRVTVLAKQGDYDSSSTTFLSETISELVVIRKLGQNFEKMPPLCQNKSTVSISRHLATLHLLYYQCVILLTKPCLLHLTKSRFHQRDHLTSGSASSNPALKILKTCVRAASHSLNILSILHEQALLERFMLLDLEMTFLAGLSLVLANLILPGITDQSFLEAARAILNDMGNAGNVPARSLKTELDDLITIIPPSSEHQSHLEEPITMTRDGSILSNSIFDVVENDLIPEDSNNHHEITQLQAAPEHNSTENPWSRLDASHSSALNSSSFQTSSGVLSSTEEYMGCVDGMNDTFTFDMADLQWLDSVQ